MGSTIYTGRTLYLPHLPPPPTPTGTPAPLATVTLVFPPGGSVPPHAPLIINNFKTPLYDEQIRVLILKPGEKIILTGKELWSAPAGTPVNCEKSFITFTWIVRDPYPVGGEDLELRHLIQNGKGRTEVLARGAKGANAIGWCDELTLFNISLVNYHIEMRHASGTHQ